MAGSYVEYAAVEEARDATVAKARITAAITTDLNDLYPHTAWAKLRLQLIDFATGAAQASYVYSDTWEQVRAIEATFNQLIAAWSDSPTAIIARHRDRFLAEFEEWSTATTDNSRCRHCGQVGGH